SQRPSPICWSPVSPKPPRVSTSAATVPTNASVPAHSPALRPRAVAARSTPSTTKAAPTSASSGPTNARLCRLPRLSISRVALANAPTWRRGDPRPRRRGRPHLLRELDQARTLEIEDQRRVDAEPDHDHPERYEREELPPVDLGQARILLVRLAEIHALQRPQHVAGGQHDRARGDHRHDRVHLPRAEQHEYL